MSEDPPTPSGRHRSKLIVGLIVVGLAATIAATVALSRNDPKPAARAPVPTTRPAGEAGRPAGEPGGAAELVRLLDAGAKVAFDGRYGVSSDGGGALSTLRLWQKPPLVRLDTESGSGAEARRSGQFALPTGPVSCGRDPAGVWTCKSDPGLRLGSGLVPDDILTKLSALVVEARDERVGGEVARCFAISGAGAVRADVCVTPDGVPVRVLASSIRIELAQLDRSPPPDEVFQPPAPPSS